MKLSSKIKVKGTLDNLTKEELHTVGNSPCFATIKMTGKKVKLSRPAAAALLKILDDNGDDCSANCKHIRECLRATLAAS